MKEELIRLILRNSTDQQNGDRHFKFSTVKKKNKKTEMIFRYVISFPFMFISTFTNFDDIGHCMLLNTERELAEKRKHAYL